MKLSIQWHCWCVVSILAGAATALGQAPAPVSSEPDIEVFVGTVKVAPIPPPPAPIVIVQEAPKPEPKEEPKPRVEAPVFVPIVPAGAWSPMMGPQPLPSSITHRSENVTPHGNLLFQLMGQVMTRLVLGAVPQRDATQPISTPQIVILREPAQETKYLPAPAPVQQSPQIVVVREPAPAPEAKPEQPHGLQISWEMLGMFSFAGVGVLCVVFLIGRSIKGQVVVQTAPTSLPITPPSYDPAKDGPLLGGQYVAGPLPETAERFDIGPSYQDEQKAKERAVEAGKQAVVANILMQNLDLFDVEEKTEK
jgi:hypothetical protein